MTLAPEKLRAYDKLIDLLVEELMRDATSPAPDANPSGLRPEQQVPLRETEIPRVPDDR